MVTTLDSKLIARLMLEYHLEQKEATEYNLSHVAVVLDRGQGAAEEAQAAGMHLHSLINFGTDGLDWLQDGMVPQEHALITDYLADPKRYSFADGADLRAKVIAEANELRGK